MTRRHREQGKPLNRRGAALFLVLFLFGAVLTLLSCQLLAGIEDRSVKATEAPPPPDAPTANLPDSPIALPSACSKVGLPESPTGVDDNVEGSYVFALSRVDFGFDGGLNEFPLNLDRTCTCPSPDSCVRPFARTTGDAAPKTPAPACDGEGGVDNATVSAIQALRGFNLISEDQLNQNLIEGISGALIRVTRYGGAANDPSVTVAFFGSTGFEGSRPTGKPDDAWTLDSESVKSKASLEPRYADEYAYVRDNLVVASFDDFPLEIGGNNTQKPLRLRLKGGKIVARIDPQNGLLHGVIAGRWATTSILETVETLRVPNVLGVNVCRGSDLYTFARNFVCAAADITTNVLDDNDRKPCSALSTVIGFDAVLARIGKVADRPIVPSSCEAGAPLPRCEDP